MSENTTNSKTKKVSKKGKVNIGAILRRPIVRLAILIVVVIVAIIVIANCFKTKEKPTNNLVGYQKLVNVTDNKYTFIDLDGKVKQYDGYTTMSDFYYDTSCVTKIDESNGGISQMALINKGGKTVVKYGEYDNIIQVIGGKYYKVEKDGKYGVIDYKGKTLIEPTYDYISITTVQEATELIFECQKDNVYYFISETGKTLMDTDEPLHSISYSNKFNEEYHTVVYISANGVRRYFDLVTGEELFKDIEGVNFSYNILKTDGKIGFYDKDVKLKEEIDVSADYSSDARVYFRKYVVVEKRTVTDGTKSYKYIVYDSNFKKVLESDQRITPVQDIDENVYFIINETDGVKIINEKKKEVKIKDYEYSGTSTNKLQFLPLNSKELSNKYDLFNFKGKKIVSDVTEYLQKGAGLVITQYNENGEQLKSLLLGNGKPIQLAANDEVVANEYYMTIENATDLTVTVVDFDGNVKVDKAKGTKAFNVEKYIGVQSDDTVSIYNVENGKQTFTYNMSDYINKDQIVNVVELNNGYFSFEGKTILEK